MNKIRVLVANQPRLMRELILETISDQPDIEIVGETHDDGQIPDLVERLHPDFLIVALSESDERPGICDVVLERHPQLKILALAPERNSSMFYWAALDIRSDRVEASEEGVLSALRSRTQVVGGQR
jgi:chemotaxis response regulator CheB